MARIKFFPLVTAASLAVTLCGCFNPGVRSISESKASIQVFPEVGTSIPLMSKNGKYVAFWANAAYVWDEAGGIRKVEIPSSTVTDFIGNDGSLYGAVLDEKEPRAFRLKLGEKAEIPWPHLDDANSIFVTDENMDGAVLGHRMSGRQADGPVIYKNGKVTILEEILPIPNWTPDIRFDNNTDIVVGKYVEGNRVFIVKWKNGKMLGEPEAYKPPVSLVHAVSSDGKSTIVENKEGVFCESGTTKFLLTGPGKQITGGSYFGGTSGKENWKLLSIIFVENKGELVFANTTSGGALNTVVWTKKSGWQTMDEFIEDRGAKLGDWKLSGKQFIQAMRCSEDGKTLALLATNGQRSAPAILRFR